MNHSRIAAIYGLEDSDGMPALIMELVPGPTLADRLLQGPMPVDEAALIARQIAEALEYAHEQGIVHRDLKPANVKITNDDTVKVLDFGLAKALEAEGSAVQSVNSPTATWMATRAGVLLGTAAYMSPEQARGKPADRRADVWAFGCVLYEMLSGRPPFRGETLAETLAAVMREEPDWTQLPAGTPPYLGALLRKCLQKDLRRRLQAIGDARVALEDGPTGSDASLQQPSVAPPQKAGSRVRGVAAIAAASAAAVTIAALGVWELGPAARAPVPVTRFTIALPKGQRLEATGITALAISADGRQLAYAAATDGSVRRLYVRAMDDFEPRAVAGAEGAERPFFSPDGQWLGFFADGALKKIPVKGGVAQRLADVTNSLGGSWAASHTIAFAPYGSVVQQVPEDGGTPTPLTDFASGETLHAEPQFLPGSSALLFGVLSSVPSSIAVQQAGKATRRIVVAGQAGTSPQYVSPGYLTYLQRGTLMAVPFDADRVELRGGAPAVPVVQDVLRYSVSANGSLAYVVGQPATGASRMVWVNRKGAVQTMGAPPAEYNQPRLSPDGRRIAVDRIDVDGSMQVWLYDLALDTLTPFTYNGSNRHSVWTRDAKRLAFMSSGKDGMRILWEAADGSGGPELLVAGAPDGPDVLTIPYSFSPSGALTFVKLFPTRAGEFWSLQTGGGVTRPPERFLESRTADGAPQLSPDGRWLAYASDQSTHRREIYVRAYPGPGGPWQVSTDGGNEPQWNPQGGELFYRSGNRLMAVGISRETGNATGKPEQLFEGNYVPTTGGYARANYDVSPDGQRFLMLQPVEQDQPHPTEINVVLNWSEELRRLVPAGTTR
jgi:serine/threonine-protein kinase